MTTRQDRFHLLMGRDNWSFPENTGLYWDDAWGSISLHPLLFHSRQEGYRAEGRHCAGQDRFGTWYWIAANREEIFFQPPGAERPRVFWPTSEGGATDVLHARESGHGFTAFHPITDLTKWRPQLSSLVITHEEYLLVSLQDEPYLILFDLLSSEPPSHLSWPGPFHPIDMASAPGGGVVILEGTTHVHCWTLDRQFRRVGPPLSLADEPAPIALELLPDGSHLILNAGADGVLSTVALYRDGYLVERQNLMFPGTALAPTGTSPPPDYPLRAYDFAFSPDPEPPPGGTCGTLYVVTENDDQCFAFRLVTNDRGLGLFSQLRYLPLYKSRGWGLMSVDDRVYYDSIESWVPLQEELHPRYLTDGQFISPILDGQEPNCVWHRIFLDAAIPPGTAITISIRSGNDPDLPDSMWHEEPQPYLRPDGSELAYYRPFPKDDQRAGWTGTWELLLQRATGRYLQIRLILTGNGRNSPRIHAMRVYYPRFSYLVEYLPDLYQTDAASASFLERYLANAEGIFTGLQQQIDHVHLLMDPRTAPPEYLDWLAGWFGFMLSPAWPERQVRLLIAHAVELFRFRGTLPGLIWAIRLATEPDADESIFTMNLDPYVGGVTTSPTNRPSFRIVEGFGDDGIHGFTIYVTIDTQGPVMDLTVLKWAVEITKPAHTQFEIKPYWSMFRVGGARLGLDTALAESGRLAGLVIGQSQLAEAYLETPPRWEEAVRQRLGQGGPRE